MPTFLRKLTDPSIAAASTFVNGDLLPVVSGGAMKSLDKSVLQTAVAPDADGSTKGLVKLAGQLGGTSALPDVRGLRTTTGPTLLTMGAVADGEVLKRSGSTIIGGSGAPLVLHLVDEKAAGTDGGTSTSGSWETRTLNTEKVDEIGSTLSSNQFTLPAGTYNIRALVPAFDCDRLQSRLRNITDSATTIAGTPAFGSSGNDCSAYSWIVGRFTIAGTKTFEIQQRVETTAATYGFGIAANFGEVETYTQVWIEKLG